MALVPLAMVPPGSEIRYPFNGVTLTVLRHGEMGTVVQPTRARDVTLTTRAGETIAFTAPSRDPQIVSSQTSVEVVTHPTETA